MFKFFFHIQVQKEIPSSRQFCIRLSPILAISSNMVQCYYISTIRKFLKIIFCLLLALEDHYFVSFCIILNMFYSFLGD